MRDMYILRRELTVMKYTANKDWKSTGIKLSIVCMRVCTMPLVYKLTVDVSWVQRHTYITYVTPISMLIVNFYSYPCPFIMCHSWFGPNLSNLYWSMYRCLQFRSFNRFHYNYRRWVGTGTGSCKCRNRGYTMRCGHISAFQDTSTVNIVHWWHMCTLSCICVLKLASYAF